MGRLALFQCCRRHYGRIRRPRPINRPLETVHGGVCLGRDWDHHDVSHAAIARECYRYIIDAVSQLLRRPPKNLEHLSCVIDACLDKSLEHIDIVTLNHDILLEETLRSAGIDFADGFGGPIGQARLWAPDSFTSQRVRLFKQHGSINWYRVRVKLDGRYQKTVMIPLVNDIEHIQIGDEEDRPLLSPQPVILGGTFNKVLSYASGIFSDVFYRMRTSMDQSKCIIISGYSFGDKGINTRLIDWVEDGEDRRIILLHEDPRALHHGARGAIRNHWENWQRTKRLIVVERWLCDSSHDEIISLCHD